jgi:hypothetical protein
MLFWTIVIAVATAVNAAVAYFMWKVNNASLQLNRDIFNATHRPFVAISQIEAVANPEERTIALSVEIKNFGSLPCRNLQSTCDLFLAGSPMPALRIPTQPIALFPGATGYFNGSLGRQYSYDRLLSGELPLDIHFQATYEGVAGQQYRTSEKNRFNPPHRNFVVIQTEWT